LGRTLSGNPAGFGAVEERSAVAIREAKVANEIRPIRNQSAGDNIIAFLVDCGQLVLGGKSDDQITMYRRQCPCRRDQTAIGGLREGCNFALNLGCRMSAFAVAIGGKADMPCRTAYVCF